VLTQAELHNWRAHATFSAGYTSALYGVRQLLQGNLCEALKLFRQEQEGPTGRLERSFASAAQASCHIWALYESGDLDAAESLVEQFQEDIFGSVIPDFTAVMMIALVRIHDVRGRVARALDTLEQLERMGHQCGWVSLVIIADWERVRRALVAGDVERARTVAAHVAVSDRLRPAEWIAVCDDFGGGSLGRIRLAIHEGDLDGAASALAAEWPRQPHRTYRNIKLSLLEALLNSAMANAHGALRSLRKAVQWAQPGGFVRCFLDEGDGILRLLREEYQRILEHGTAERAFVERVLAASGTDLTQLAPAPRLAEPLSKREIQMLSMLANGVSNREIAARLFVSENTVKYHLKNIYAKLTVTSRTQAINVARQLQIVG
jgi:LuxR family maltose regulon positive regulatory protein